VQSPIRRFHDWSAAAALGYKNAMRIALTAIGALLTLACLTFCVLVTLTDRGLFRPYPEPPAQAMEQPVFGRSATIEFGSLFRQPSEPLADYHQRLTEAVNAWMVHYWPAEDRSFVGVHPLDNYPMWLMSFFPNYAHFGNYEFVNPLSAWRRGYGLCSQVSRIIYSVLRAQGLDSTIMKHPNHVVVEANGTILDADYGVYIPHSLSYMKDHVYLVEKYYKSHESSWPLLKKIYATGWVETWHKAGFDKTLSFEAQASRWKWAPMFMALWMSVVVLYAGLRWPRFSIWFGLLFIGPRGKRQRGLAAPE